MKNFLEMLINKEFKLFFFLHFIEKNDKFLNKTGGNYDLRKTYVLKDKGEIR